MSTTIREANIYATRFAEAAKRLPGSGQPWLEQLRKQAMTRFLDLGFPTTRLEEWKFTNIAPISGITFETFCDQSDASVPESLQSQPDLSRAPRLMFTDGRLDQRYSSARHSSGAAANVYVEGLADSFGDPDVAVLLESHFGRYAGTSAGAFVAWNSAFFADGACVVIPPGTIVHDPIYIVFVSLPGRAPRATFPRNLIVVGEGAQVAIAEVFLSASEDVHLTNAVSEIVVGAGATVDYYNLELGSSNGFHVAAIQCALERDANLTSHSVSLGAKLCRNDFEVVLDGEGSSCTLNGLFLAGAHRLVDNHTSIDHRQPHGTSRELYKGVLSGHGRGVFNGAINVRKGAQKTDALQHSKNLLLSENAQINTKPQLEIRADDVRCSHGASIGQLDQDALFYLKTRGVAERVARRMLIRGFASEITESIRVQNIRDQVEVRIDDWFEKSEEV